MIRVNRTRTDYLEKFEALIESYNAGSRNIDELFRELLALSQSLSDEEQRHVREQLTEEELTVFDLLTRPGPDLTRDEREEVKRSPAISSPASLAPLPWGGVTRPRRGHVALDHALPFQPRHEACQCRRQAVRRHAQPGVSLSNLVDVIPQGFNGHQQLTLEPVQAVAKVLLRSESLEILLCGESLEVMLHGESLEILLRGESLEVMLRCQSWENVLHRGESTIAILHGVFHFGGCHGAESFDNRGIQRDAGSYHRLFSATAMPELLH